MIMNISIYHLCYICSLAVEIDKKGDDRDTNFEVKRQKALEKMLSCKFIKSNTNNDLDYELGNIQTFIYEFKNNKKLETISE